MFKNISIGRKLTTAFVAVSATAVVIAAFAWAGMSQMNKAAHELAADEIPSLMALSRVRTGVSDLRRLELALIATKAEKADAEYAARRAEIAKIDKEEVEGGAAAYEKTPKTPAQEQAWRDAQRAVTDYRNAVDKMPALLDANNLAQATSDALGPNNLAFQAASDALAKSVAGENAAAAAAWDMSAAAYSRSRMVVMTVAIVAFLGAIGLGLMLTGTITRPLALVVSRAEELRARDVTELGRGIAAMSHGDLTRSSFVAAQPIDIDQKDEIGVLATALNGVITQTRDTSTELTRAQDRIRELIEELAAITRGAKNGQLGTRGDAAKFQGAYREVVSGVNATLDAVTAPIDEAINALQRVAKRDLSVRVVGTYDGDHAKMKEAINAAVQNLDEALSEVSAASEQVASAADQITSGSQLLAQGSSEQASSLEEVSSSLQEMASMAKQSAVNAKEARGLADTARMGTTRGVESMERLTKAMDRIKASSDATAKIVKTIDEIAFQTNLLALNAAVEAARAGDAGKGFAVVADEVRSLAMRSAEAAKNTANLIEEAVKNAEGGVHITDEVVRNLGDISGSVTKVSDVMGEIAAASDQQTQGITQVNGAIDQMNSVTQQNAANSEESAAAAEELSSQAARMQEMVETFRLTSGGSTRQSKRPASMPMMPAMPATPATPSMSASPAKRPMPATPSRAPNRVPPAIMDRLSPQDIIPFHDDGDDDTLREF